MTCIECKSFIPEGSVYCMKCGAAQQIDMGVTLLPSLPIAGDEPEKLKDKQHTPCPECGAERVFATFSETSYLSSPKFQVSKLFSQSSYLDAVVCTNCGLTTFYARTPKNVVVKRADKPIKDS